MYVYLDPKKAIERVKKAEVASKYIPPFCIVVLTIFPIFIFYGDPDNPSRIPMPHVHIVYLLAHYMFLYIPILGLYIYILVAMRAGACPNCIICYFMERILI